MKCTQDECKINPEPKIHWSYWRTSPLSFITFECITHKKLIYGTNTDEILFENSLSQCKAYDLYCQFNDAIMIWEKSIIHPCPYYKIKVDNFVITDNIAISKSNMFQIKNKIKSI